MDLDQTTGAASSGIALDKKQLKALAKRSDGPGLRYLSLWVLALLVTGAPIWAVLSWWQPGVWSWAALIWAMVVYGAVLTVPAYAMSHETAHGTAFRSRWLNEAVFWLTSLIYMEEPLHRRYTHTNHHSYTWHAGKDSQMPFDTPMGLGGWLLEISGLALLRFHALVLLRLLSGRYSPVMRDVTPPGEFAKMTRNAWVFALVYAGLGGAIVAGQSWLLWFLVLPRLLGAPVMLLFTLIQHVEMQENHPSILESTRSFRTSWLGRFLYMNMNHHIEHHLYPLVPFHALPKLGAVLEPELPAPDPGFWRTNLEVAWVVARRSLGRSTKAPSIRQAPHMISAGGRMDKVARRSM
jgi:fatty acid desaturase